MCATSKSNYKSADHSIKQAEKAAEKQVALPLGDKYKKQAQPIVIDQNSEIYVVANRVPFQRTGARRPLPRSQMSDEEVIDKRTWRDSLQAVTGMQVGKAGFGMYAMDKFVDDIGRVFDGSVEAEQALAKVGVEFSSNIISTYFMPFTPFQDAYNTFIADDDARIIRENNIEDLGTLMIRKSLSRVPGNFFIEELLNDAFGTEFDIPKTYESPTRTGLLRRQTPISRQLTGRLFQERKTDLEKELDNLIVKYPDAQIVGHYMLDEAKTCPNFNVREYLLNEDIKNYKFQDGLTDDKDLQELE